MTDTWQQIDMLTSCDRCQHEWRPVLRLRSTVSGGQEWFFRCPRCSKRYDMATITRRGVELRSEMEAVRADESLGAEERVARLTELSKVLLPEITGRLPGDE